MMQTSQLLEHRDYVHPLVKESRRLSIVKFFLRYPIFLLAFGPPAFKSGSGGVDTSQAHFDLWNVFQVGWISVIAIRALARLALSRPILIPKQSRSILKWAFYLGVVFLISVSYSPDRILSSEFLLLYFMTWVCMAEFLVDAYRNPPDWLQCLFHLRTITFLLMVAVVLTLPFAPRMVMAVLPGVGIRLLGGSVAPMGVCPPIVAIVSAYALLNSLESRFRSVFFFLVGVAGTLLTQARGAELALLLALAVLVFGWATTSRRSMYIFVSASTAIILLAGAILGTIGGERVWSAFNRGEDIEGIATVSGRTVVWSEIIEYCYTHPQGMGYIAGIRQTHRVGAATSMHDLLNRSGGVDNSFIQVLGDAGWLALAIYLTTLAKTIVLGIRSLRWLVELPPPSAIELRHGLHCSLLLLLFCLAEEMETSGFTTPLQEPFYFQNIVIVMILGVFGSVLIATRLRYPLGRDNNRDILTTIVP